MTLLLMLLACGDKEQAEDSGLEAAELIEPKVQESQETEPSEPEDTSPEEETEEDTGGEA